ncbi:hypothetical protein LV78_005383 [Actinosynnema pretiosum]|nr:hypothetical protein [Actinosynnema pretiosum]
MGRLLTDLWPALAAAAAAASWVVRDLARSTHRSGRKDRP